MPKKCVTIYVEGQTDEEFYNRFKNIIKTKIPDKKFKVDVLKVVCIKGIGKFSGKLLARFKNEIINNYKGYEKIVFLCYDHDVFEFGVRPPIDRKKLEEDLKNLGANKVYHIVADRTIEDFFMIDEQSIIKYLRLKKRIKVKGKTGLEQIKYLFKCANRTYQKGSKVEGLVESLNMDLICSKICEQLFELCIELGSTCNKYNKNLSKKEKIF
ncbi:MAG: hypothetical protein PHE05_01950 [Bacilli bacterium]|nr:hypothetical protein [Bacilli bacterium]